VVALAQRVSKLEKRVAADILADPLEDQTVYQPSEEEFAEAIAILVECGAARFVYDEDPDAAPS
jgi:hypothetical protein